MKAIGRALIARAYRKLRPWLEAIEHQDATQHSLDGVPGLYHFPTFLVRLGEELARAECCHLELGVVVFQVPPSAAARRPQRGLEIALRDCLRKTDIPGRLSENMLGVILPETGQGAEAAADRMARLLSRVAGHPIASGFARYPADGQKASDLLRTATERSTTLVPPALTAAGRTPDR